MYVPPLLDMETWFKSLIQHQNENMKKFALTGFVSVDFWHNFQWCFLFCKEDVTPLQGALKIIADQPCYNAIFYLRSAEHKY